MTPGMEWVWFTLWFGVMILVGMGIYATKDDP